MLKINNRHTIERVHDNHDNNGNYDKSSRKHIEEMLSHFINLRNVMEYNRLTLRKASEKTLSENTGNGCSRNCVLAAGNCRVAATARMD